MIPELFIRRTEFGSYESSVELSGVALSNPTTHVSIEDALMYVAANAKPDLYEFIEVRYCEISIGTQAVMRLRQEQFILAQQMLDCLDAVRRAQAEMAQKRTMSAAAKL